MGENPARAAWVRACPAAGKRLTFSWDGAQSDEEEKVLLLVVPLSRGKRKPSRP